MNLVVWAAFTALETVALVACQPRAAGLAVDCER